MSDRIHPKTAQVWDILLYIWEYDHIPRCKEGTLRCFWISRYKLIGDIRSNACRSFSRELAQCNSPFRSQSDRLLSQKKRSPFGQLNQFRLYAVRSEEIAFRVVGLLPVVRPIGKVSTFRVVLSISVTNQFGQKVITLLVNLLNRLPFDEKTAF